MPLPAPAPAFDQSRWRHHIPILASHVLMNACSHSPQSGPTRAAADDYLDRWNTHGMEWDRWMDAVQGARRAFAQLINASDDEIAVCSSVSDATSAVAGALDFSGTRRRALVTEAEFPTVGHVWLAQERRGAQVAWVPVRDGAVDAADVRRKTASTAFVMDNAAAVEAAMRARHVLASARGPVLRLAPHFFTTLDDVDRALDGLVEAGRPS